jgi:hypothetical protein
MGQDSLLSALVRTALEKLTDIVYSTFIMNEMIHQGNESTRKPPHGDFDTMADVPRSATTSWAFDLISSLIAERQQANNDPIISDYIKEHVKVWSCYGNSFII